MDPEIASILTTAAATLVAAATTDVWQQVRNGFARLLGRGDHGQEMAATRRLDALATAVEQASPDKRAEVRQQLQADWGVRLADLIEDDPAVAYSLRSLVDQVRAQLPAPQQQWVQNITASAAGATAQGVMFGGSIINHADPSASQQDREQEELRQA